MVKEVLQVLVTLFGYSLGCFVLLIACAAFVHFNWPVSQKLHFI